MNDSYATSGRAYAPMQSGGKRSQLLSDGEILQSRTLTATECGGQVLLTFQRSQTRALTKPGKCLMLYFILIKIFNYGAFYTRFSRWQIPTVYDFKDRHDIQLLQTETAAFEVCRQFLATRRLQSGAQDRTHSSDRHTRTRNQSPAKRAAILRRRTL